MAKKAKKILRIKSKYIAGSIGDKKYRTFKNYNDWVKWENIYDRISSYGGIRNQSELADEMFHTMGKKVIFKSLQNKQYKEIMHYEEYDTYFLYPGSK